MNQHEKLVTYNFDVASKGYLNYAYLQKQAAKKITTYLPAILPELTLDLGSGPGTLSHTAYKQSSLILYDLSYKMLKAGRSHDNLFKLCPKIKKNIAINGNATHLPFKDNSIPLIISNLMLQWPEDKQSVLKEIYRTLTFDGTVIFTSLINPSLWQLQKVWNNLDNKSHTLEFLSANYYMQLCQSSGLNITTLNTWEHIEYFNSCNELLHHFKYTGTSMPKAQSRGLGGKQNIAKLEDEYSKFKTENGLPLNYNYILIVAKKM
jgi:malonyl-CoA O-methyltransferase